MGFQWYKNCYHVPFGQIRFEDSPMRTREGKIIFLEEVLDKAVEIALKIIQEKNPTLRNKEEVAEAVGVGSIIFNDLKNNRIKDVTFNWDEILNFNGETGPYLQYTYARIKSLLKKFQDTYGPIEFREGLPWGDEGYSLNLLINDFENTVVKSSEVFEPSIISRYLLDIASQFNSFYNTHRVVSDNFSLSLARALIVRGVMTILGEGLSLLGITAVNEM
jgi:arginyl-tRNA synthetase